MVPGKAFALWISSRTTKCTGLRKSVILARCGRPGAQEHGRKEAEAQDKLSGGFDDLPGHLARQKAPGGGLEDYSEREQNRFGRRKFLSYIENKATGTKIPLKIENGVYVMEVAATPKKAPFQGQAK